MLCRRISQVREAVDFGKQLHEAFSMVPFFPLMFAKLVALRESSCHLSSSFARICIQIQKSQKIMGWFNRLIEPVLMIFIAVGMLEFLLSLYIPIFKMAEQF